MPLHLTARLQYMLEQNIRFGTNNQYKSAFNHYIKFCNKYNLIPFPLTELQYMYYVADSLGNIQASTIKSHMSGLIINYHSKIRGFPINLIEWPLLQSSKKALDTTFGSSQTA